MTNSRAGADEVDVLGVPAAHARSVLAEAIAAVPGGSPTTTVAPAASQVEQLVGAHSTVPHPTPAESAEPAVQCPAARVAPGGDVEAWEVLDDAPSTGGPPELVALPGSLVEHPSSALDGLRAEFTAMRRDGIVQDPIAPAELFAAAIRAGHSATTPTAEQMSLVEVADPAGPDVDVSDWDLLAAPEHEPGPELEGEVEVEPDQELVGHLAVSDVDDADPQPAPAAAVSLMAEDFGPLLPSAATPSRRRSLPAAQARRAPGRRGRAWPWATALVGVVVLAVAGVWSLGRESNTVPAGGESSAAAVGWQSWNGIELPVSAVDGPAVVDGDRVRGFSRSPLGAAIAAAHLSVRVDPAVGEQVWGPVLASQVVGDVDRLRAALEAAPESAQGQPGRLTGWRLEGDPQNAALVVHLAVEAADGQAVDYAIPLAWSDGDWALDIARFGAFFPMGDTEGRLYTDFGGQQ